MTDKRANKYYQYSRISWSVGILGILAGNGSKLLRYFPSIFRSSFSIFFFSILCAFLISWDLCERVRYAGINNSVASSWDRNDGTASYGIDNLTAIENTSIYMKSCYRAHHILSRHLAG